MNKTLKFLVAGVSAACAFGATAEETAFYGQAIGSIQVVSSTTNTIVAVAFKELSADESQAVSVSNILSTVNLVEGDKVFVMNGTSYHSWTLNSSGYWEANDQTYSIDAGGVQFQGVGGQANGMRPSVGQGFWLQRVGQRDSMPSCFYIFGAAVAPLDAQSAAAGVKSLIGNPNNANKKLVTEGANSGDTIGLVANDGALLKEYKYISGTGWAQLVKGSAPLYLPSYQSADVIVPAGQGFWYNSTGSSNVGLSWTDVTVQQ